LQALRNINQLPPLLRLKPQILSERKHLTHPAYLSPSTAPRKSPDECRR
jgi:hypothetical protein